MKNIMLKGAALLGLMMLPGLAQANTLDFTYNVKGDTPLVYGNGLKETYDVAIRIQDPALVGATVKGIYVEVPGNTDCIGEASAWLTTDLILWAEGNHPNITRSSGWVVNDMLRVDFERPYTLTEEGVYVGYSFTVKELNEKTEYPVAVVYGDNPDGFFLHSSRSMLRWMNMAELLGANSAMTVVLEGNFPDDAAIPTIDGNLYSAVGQPSNVSIRIVNKGTQPIGSFEYSYKAGDYAGTGSYTMPKAIDAVYNSSAVASLPIDAIDKVGVYDFELTLTKVNGKENTINGATAETQLEVKPFLPKNRPLVEEYTGLWCGYCPRGYVALETMKEEYGTDFISLAYHDGDAMATIASDDLPYDVSGYPDATINRSEEMDPSELYELWPAFRSKFAPADIEVKLEWTDADKTSLKATSTTTFVDDEEDAEYYIGFALVADGLSNPRWRQSNYYSGESPEDCPEMPGELGKVFLDGDSYVTGLVFNDVVIALPEPEGFDYSVPENIVANTPYEFSYTFENVADIKNLDGDPVVQDVDKLRVVAFICDWRGESLNSNTSLYADGGDPNAVEGIDADASVVSTVYHDLQGRRVARPANGVYIRTDRLDNGTVRVSKQVIR